MEFAEILRKRRMVRSFDGRPVDAGTVERILAAGLRGPSAGFTQGVELLVLQGQEQTRHYWDASLPADRRPGFPWPGLFAAPVLVVVLSSEAVYRRRYDEIDKGGGRAQGDLVLDMPWWHVDAAFAALLLQLAAVDAGLGALFFAAHGVVALRESFGIPEAFEPVGTVAIGHPAPDRLSSSVVGRRRREADDVIHRGRW